MLDQLTRMSIPRWLADISSSTITDKPFPIAEVLKDSLYYPSSGFDGDPVKYLAGNIFSFIYVDSGHSFEEFIGNLNNSGFRGYELFTSRSVSERELVPRGWRPEPPSRSDGNPKRYKSWLENPFCYWAIFQRSEDVPDTHGPARFSLLYLCADGVAAFQALYQSNNIFPKVVTIIQPGHGFGGNWTDFTKPGLICERTVMGNPQGQPEILIYGGIGKRDFYREPCWPIYRDLVCFLDKDGGGSIGVWTKSA